MIDPSDKLIWDVVVLFRYKINPDAVRLQLPIVIYAIRNYTASNSLRTISNNSTVILVGFI